MNNWQDHITFEPGKRSGQPCIRGMRFTVSDAFSYLASGMSIPEIINEFPFLTPEDFLAIYGYAAEKCKKL